LRTASANSSRDHISKLTRAKWTVGAAEAIGHLHYKHKALSSNPSHTKKINRKKHKAAFGGVENVPYFEQGGNYPRV
jgi:hypothetical protein